MFIIYIIGGVVLGFTIKSILTKRIQEAGNKEVREQVQNIEKTKEEIKKKEAEIEKENNRVKEEFEKDNFQIQEEIKKEKLDIKNKSRECDRKFDLIQKKESEIAAREKEIENIKIKYSEKEKELEEIRTKEQSVLQNISRYSPREAREQLMKSIEEEAEVDAKRSYQIIVENARRDAQRKAVEIIAQAVQRNASEITQELTVSTVKIDEDMKGRIIGREGRNIRSLEAAAGVNLIIDDTPGIITISSYDGVKREITKRALELLMKDGRIQPTRIEEIVFSVKKDVEDMMKKAGEDAAMEVGTVGLHYELLNILGKLKFRTSYGQNVLDHSITVAYLAGVMADELRIDADFARRAGLLHDIGKAIDREVEGNHADIGAKLAKKYGESDRLQNAILSHHEEAEPQTAEAILIQAADAVSASRPGARQEHIAHYMKRLENIEDIAKNFEGVHEAYCLAAGREIRIIVEPEKVSDEGAGDIAKHCAKKISEQIEYPGEIKVTVIRSLRSVEMAR